jgi:hypothetical protein
MIYLINITLDGRNAISAKCTNEDGATELERSLKSAGIDVYRVGWLCYWLQKHSFYKLAAAIAPMSNP